MKTDFGIESDDSRYFYPICQDIDENGMYIVIYYTDEIHFQLVGYFNASTPLVIDDDTNGLEIQFSFSGVGFHVEGGSGGALEGFTCNNPDPLICHPRAEDDQPIYAYAGDFQRVLKFLEIFNKL